MSADDYGEPCTTQRLRAMVADLRPDILAHSTTAWAADEIDRLRAKLAALKARRCDGCANWDGNVTLYNGEGICRTNEIIVDDCGGGAGLFTMPDFACNAWEPKP